jgi:hypothetical protein
MNARMPPSDSRLSPGAPDMPGMEAGASRARQRLADLEPTGWRHASHVYAGMSSGVELNCLPFPDCNAMRGHGAGYH